MTSESKSPPSQPEQAPAPALAQGPPPVRWARSVLAQFAHERTGILRTIVGATQLHARGGCSDAEFEPVGQFMSGHLYNGLTSDEPTIHFAAATLCAAMGTQPSGVLIQAALTTSIQQCIAALFNLIRAQEAALPDCTEDGRKLLRRIAEGPAAATPPPAESSSS